MFRFLILFCLICVAYGRIQRIIGGQNIDIEHVPYQVSIKTVSGFHNCGGVIISKNYVLTAGHCADKPRGFYFIQAGSSSWIKGGDTHWVEKVIRHKGYLVDKFQKPANDIALMKVTPAFDLSNKAIKPIELTDRPVKAEDIGLLTGWGKTANKGPSTPTLLQFLTVKVLSEKECNDKYKVVNGMTTYNFCAEHPSKTKDLCDGDSGGPLVVDGKLAGLVSWATKQCAVPDKPGVYVDVYKYLDWINKTMRDN